MPCTQGIGQKQKVFHSHTHTHNTHTHTYKRARTHTHVSIAQHSRENTRRKCPREAGRRSPHPTARLHCLSPATPAAAAASAPLALVYRTGNVTEASLLDTVAAIIPSARNSSACVRGTASPHWIQRRSILGLARKRPAGRVWEARRNKPALTTSSRGTSMRAPPVATPLTALTSIDKRIKCTF